MASLPKQIAHSSVGMVGNTGFGTCDCAGAEGTGADGVGGGGLPLVTAAMHSS